MRKNIALYIAPSVVLLAVPFTMMSLLERARRSFFTFTVSSRDDVFESSVPYSSHTFHSTRLRSLPTTRLVAVVSAFIVGFAFTVIMKYEHVLWLAASTAGATPLLQFGQGGTFDYPGLRFGADKKFSITVFSDLHLGEREFDIQSACLLLTDCL